MKIVAGMVVLTIALSACANRAPAQRTAPAPLSHDDRIRRVERGLLRAIAIVGQPDPPLDLSDRMTRYAVPGVSIALIDGYRIAWTRGYGVADAETLDPVTPATLFQAGSISKPIAATAALHLAERGVLDLDEDVNRKLTSWKVPVSDFTRDQKVTLRRLLSHSAGFSLPGFPGYRPGESLPSVPRLLDGLLPANTPAVVLESIPGTRWSYSGGGYMVMQQLLEDATGMSFITLMEKTVLAPLGMTDSTFDQELPGKKSRAASGHHPGGAKVAGGRRVHPELAAAGLWSTPSDLARWAIELQQSSRGLSDRVLSSEMTRTMLTPQIENWGLGPVLSGSGSAMTFGHEGSTEGYVAEVIAFPATGQGVVVMTNGGSGSPLIDEIVRSIAHEYGWAVPPRQQKSVASVDAGVYEELAGRYRIDLGDRNIDVSVTTDGSHLYFIGSSGQPAEILPEAELRYFSAGSGTEFVFVRDGSGQTSELIIVQEGSRFTARRMK